MTVSKCCLHQGGYLFEYFLRHGRGTSPRPTAPARGPLHQPHLSLPPRAPFIFFSTSTHVPPVPYLSYLVFVLLTIFTILLTLSCSLSCSLSLLPYRATRLSGLVSYLYLKHNKPSSLCRRNTIFNANEHEHEHTQSTNTATITFTIYPSSHTHNQNTIPFLPPSSPSSLFPSSTPST